MKKHLFIFSLAMAALAANAQTKQPATITTYKPADLETVLYCVSENGKYAAGDFGGVALLDLETGEKGSTPVRVTRRRRVSGRDRQGRNQRRNNSRDVRL